MKISWTGVDFNFNDIPNRVKANSSIVEELAFTLLVFILML